MMDVQQSSQRGEYRMSKPLQDLPLLPQQYFPGVSISLPPMELKKARGIGVAKYSMGHYCSFISLIKNLQLS